MADQSSSKAEFRAVLAAATGSTCVGFVPFFVSGLQKAGVDTVSTLVWRYLVALAVLLPLTLARHSLLEEWRRGGKWLMLNALTLGTLQVLCYFRAIETLPTSVVVTVFYCYPVLALALDRYIYKIPVTPAALGAVLIIIAGVALISFKGLVGATLDGRGIALTLLAAAGYTAYIAAAYPMTKRVEPLASAVFIYGAYALTFGATTLVTGFALPPRPELWVNVLFIGTLGGALQILSFAYALPRLAASGYAVIVCLEVVTVVLAGVLLLGERLAAVQWLGIVLVLGGIAIARSRKRVTVAADVTPAKPRTDAAS